MTNHLDETIETWQKHGRNCRNSVSSAPNPVVAAAARFFAAAAPLVCLGGQDGLTLQDVLGIRCGDVATGDRAGNGIKVTLGLYGMLDVVTT